MNEQTQQTPPMHIVRFEASNFKRLKAVEITPDGKPVVILSGKNDQGKTSVIDAIQFAFAGKGALCERPIRDGASTTRIVCDLQRITVTRKLTSSGVPTLVVAAKDGTKISSPQTVLDELFNDVALDPLSFVRMKPAEQRDTLCKLVGLDFTEIEANKKKLYEERTGKNRDLSNAKGKLSGYTFDTTAPSDEVSIQTVMGELEAVQEANKLYQQLKDALNSAKTTLQSRIQDKANTEQSIREIEELLAEKRQLLEKQIGAIGEAEQNVTVFQQKLAQREVADEAPVRAKLSAIDDTNSRVRSNKRFNELKSEVFTLQTSVDELTGKITALEDEKVQKLSSAKFPLPGLSFDDSGVLLNGVPFSQGSQARQLQAAVAIGLALNPRIRVILIRDGSLLDDDSMALLSKMAIDADAQVWIERVCDDTPGSIVIEDGMVKE